MFPDVDPDYVRGLITANINNPYPVNVVCNVLLENPQYPRLKKNDAKKEPETVVKKESKVKVGNSSLLVGVLEKR